MQQDQPSRDKVQQDQPSRDKVTKRAWHRPEFSILDIGATLVGGNTPHVNDGIMMSHHS